MYEYAKLAKHMMKDRPIAQAVVIASFIATTTALLTATACFNATTTAMAEVSASFIAAESGFLWAPKDVLSARIDPDSSHRASARAISPKELVCYVGIDVLGGSVRVHYFSQRCYWMYPGCFVEVLNGFNEAHGHTASAR